MKIELKANGKGKYNIMVSHSDLDGVGCVIVGLARFGDDLNWYCCENNNVNERVLDILEYLTENEIPLENVNLYITDLSVDNGVAEVLHNYHMNGMGLQLLDHHKTAEHLNKYNWCFVISNGTHCGTTLTHRSLGFPSAGKTFADGSNDLESFVDVVKDHDLWIKKDPRSDKYNRLLGIMGRDAFIERFSTGQFDFTEGEYLLLEYDIKQEDKYFEKLSKSIKIYKDRLDYGIVFADRYISNMGHRLMNKHDLDFVVLLNPTSGSISLRSRNEIDVSHIAKKLDGGGHRNASGFPWGFYETYMRIDDIVEEEIDKMIP